jgi:hypothetical protein
MGPRRPFFLIAASVVAAPLLAACGDPGGPNLSGSIRLGPGVDASTFKTLQLRVYPDSAATFDASAIPSTAYSDVSEASEAFPHSYLLGEPLGTTPSSTWRLVAWLSHQDEAAAHVLPEKGDILCTTTAGIKGCGTYGGYCGNTPGVDCTLTTALP